MSAIDDIAKQTIGNYKGVMLCNRPNENIAGKSGRYLKYQMKFQDICE